MKNIKDIIKESSYKSTKGNREDVLPYFIYTLYLLKDDKKYETCFYGLTNNQVKSIIDYIENDLDLEINNVDVILNSDKPFIELSKFLKDDVFSDKQTVTRISNIAALNL